MLQCRLQKSSVCIRVVSVFSMVPLYKWKRQHTGYLLFIVTSIYPKRNSLSVYRQPCLCVHMCVSIHVWGCMYTLHRHVENLLTLRTHTPCFLRQGISLGTQGSQVRLDWLANESQPFPRCWAYKHDPLEWRGTQLSPPAYAGLHWPSYLPSTTELFLFNLFYWL